jgi:hypothetical protein
MAITKNNLSDLIRDIKLGGDPTMAGRFHPTMIWKAADTVIGSLIEASMFKSKDSNGYDINGDWISTYGSVPVLNDTDRDEKYSVLPAQVISLKQNRGLHRISEMKNREDAYVQVPNGSHDIFSILDVHYHVNKTEFYLEGNKIFYRNIGVQVDKVLIKMVAGIANLDSDAPIPVPSILEEELVTRVINLLGIENQDKGNDNNSNKFNV